MKKKLREKERGRKLEEGRRGKDKEERRRKRKKESYYMTLSPVLFPLYSVAFEIRGAGTIITT